QLLTVADKKGIHVISELQLALEQLDNVRIIAVTGTNGKTTTTELISHLTGIISAGNIGNPLCDEVDNIRSGDTVILEVSSYQIYYSKLFIPYISVLLNIFPEHLTWHGNFEKYRETKIELIRKQEKGCYAVVNKDIDNIENILKGLAPEIIYYSSTQQNFPGIYIKDGYIVKEEASGGIEKLVSLDSIMIPGIHNIENTMAALGVCSALGEGDLSSISDYRLSDHRIEVVYETGGVRFINDSKATNMDSVYRAVQSIETPLLLLMGGRTKRSMHPLLKDLAKERVKKIFSFGESRFEIEDAFKGNVKIELFTNMRDAVLTAWKESVSGETVLLSPGGSSFDEFDDYKHRGEVFKSIVLGLKEEERKGE
ncbi:UDP-N-acetylmuramoyl-L-alanine--D-glutamate ligase, partial [Elusimicrobiota bacterium]